jgi:SAM-dependent methyltransferase
MAIIKPFDEHPDIYEQWFEKNRYVYLSELEAVKKLLPGKGNGVEIGVGSGRFAAPLGIKSGVEPSPVMSKIARQRGITTLAGSAENLPLGSSSFNFVLMVTTICFLDDVMKSFLEVNRILKKNGQFIIGFVDSNSTIGKEYEKFKEENIFYKYATFFSTDEIMTFYKKAGFSKFKTVQTIFGRLEEIKSIEPVLNGYGKGSFVVIKGVKIKETK